MPRPKAILSRFAVILAAVLVFISLTGMSRIGSGGPIHPIDSTLPALAQVAATISPSSTPAAAEANAPDETMGIILAGAILVLIILGGTFGATQRRKS
jgi:hypothetical protein